MVPIQITKAKLEQTLFAIPDNYTVNNVYTILDGASVNDLPATLKTFNADFICLYRGELDQEMQLVAPYLVALQQNTDLFHWVFSGIGHHWGIFIVTTADFPTLRKHFRSFLMIYDTEKEPIYFRYYDPRVLRDFLPVSNKEQKNALFGPVLDYYVESKITDQLYRFSLPAGEHQPNSPPYQFIISQQQMKQLTLCAFMERNRAFLMQRSRKNTLRDILQQPEIWKPLWTQLLSDTRSHHNTHDSAILISFSLDCVCEQLDPIAEIKRLQQSAESYYQMKSFLEAKGYLRFSEFELDTPAK